MFEDVLQSTFCPGYNGAKDILTLVNFDNSNNPHAKKLCEHTFFAFSSLDVLEITGERNFFLRRPFKMDSSLFSF